MTALVVVLAAFWFAYKMTALFVEKPTASTPDDDDELEVVSTGFQIGFCRPEEEDEDDE